MATIENKRFTKFRLQLEVTRRTFNSGFDDSGSIYFFVYA